MQERQTGDPKFSGAWAARPVTMAQATGTMFLVGGMDAMYGLDAAQGAGSVTVSAMAARIALDSFARSWRILDPSLTAKARLGRAYGEKLYAITEVLKMPRDAANHKEAKRREGEIHNAAKYHSLNLVGKFHLNESWCDSTTAVRTLLATPSDPKGGEAIFRMLSGIGHATTVGLDSNVVDASKRVDQLVGTLMLMDDLKKLMLSFVTLGFDAAFVRLMSFYGWTWQSFEAASIEAHRQVAPEMDIFSGRVKRKNVV
jgi:hypothetical protein